MADLFRLNRLQATASWVALRWDWDLDLSDLVDVVWATYVTLTLGSTIP